MPPFTHNNKQRRPKFLFNLQINELVNVPQSSGDCYVKWYFKEGTGTSGSSLPPDTNIETSSQSKGSTPRAPVQHHRAQWNCALNKPVQIKLHVDKNRDIVPKYLIIEVYYEAAKDTPRSPSSPTSAIRRSFDIRGDATNGNGNISKTIPSISSASTALKNPLLKSSSLRSPPTSFELHRRDSTSSMNSNVKYMGSNTYSQKVSGKLYLGKISINVAEYIREEEEPISNRFLLKDSKINCILSITFQLKLIRGTYDDFKIPTNFTTGQLSSSFQNSISNLLDNNGSDISTNSPISSTFANHQTNNPLSSSANSSKSRPLLSHPTQPSINTSSFSNTSKSMSTISNSLNPLIESLYEKTFQLTWDPRPNEYSPRECIEDILRGGNGWAKNENGINLIDVQALRLKNMESKYYSNSDSYIIEPTPDDDKYWNNLDNREYLERKDQQKSSRRSDSQRQKLRVNTINGSNYDNEIDENPTDSIVRDTKSWSVKHTLG